MVKKPEVLERYNLRLPKAQLAKLEAIREKVGVPVNESIRRAIDAYLEKEHK